MQLQYESSVHATQPLDTWQSSWLSSFDIDSLSIVVFVIKAPLLNVTMGPGHKSSDAGNS